MPGAEGMRDQWIRAQEQATLNAQTPVTGSTPLEQLRAVRPDLAERFEAAQRKVADLVWGVTPRPEGRAVDWFPHKDFIHFALTTPVGAPTKGGNPMPKVRLPIDPGMAMLAEQHGLPYDVVVEAADAEAMAQNERTWRIAETTVRTAVLAMRKHRKLCGLPDCAGEDWQQLIGRLEWEQLAVVFAAATQMLMEYLPEYDKGSLQTELIGMRPDVTGTPDQHAARVTARVIERARAIIAARLSAGSPESMADDSGESGPEDSPESSRGDSGEPA